MKYIGAFILAGAVVVLIVVAVTRNLTGTPKITAEFTSTPQTLNYVVSTKIPTAIATSTFVVTATPVATEIPTVAPTTEATAPIEATPCTDAKVIVDGLAKIAGTVRVSENNWTPGMSDDDLSGFKSSVNQAMVITNWSGYAVSTGKEFEKVIEFGGQK